jgi:cullin 1
MMAEAIDIEPGWHDIKTKALDRLEDIIEGGFKEGGKMFPNVEFSHIYTMAYNMCTQNGAHNHSAVLYKRHGRTMSDYLTKYALPVLRESQGEALLKEFLKRGENHAIMNKWNKKFFSYLDRFYTTLDHKNGNSRKLPSLEQAGMIVFKTVIFDQVKADLTAALIEMINSEREGIIIDRDLVRKVIIIYEKMGAERHDVYKADFEEAFLAASRDFYKALTELWIVRHSTSEYMAMVEKVMEDERGRANAYLVPSATEEKLQVVVRVRKVVVVHHHHY